MLYWLLVPLQKYVSFFRRLPVHHRADGLGRHHGPRHELPPRPLAHPAAPQARQIGQEIRSDGPQSHYAKKGTPSMGGILIIGATLVADAPLGEPGQRLRLDRHGHHVRLRPHRLRRRFLKVRQKTVPGPDRSEARPADRPGRRDRRLLFISDWASRGHFSIST